MGAGISARILAVANQKGGVGKTTTVINLGAYLGALDHRVLLVDVDPQCNTTRGIAVPSPVDATLYDVLVNSAAAEHAIAPTNSPNVSLLAASPDLAGSEVELLDAADRERTLKSALHSISQHFDYVLLDCPPSLGLLTVNALVAANAVIVPVQCEYLALEGVGRLVDTISRIRSNLNPELRIFGLLMTMYDRRTSLSEQVAQEVRRHYPDLTFRTMIPRNVRLSEAPSFGQTIGEYDPHSIGAQAYSSLAQEVSLRG
jgi:chromosome partitioning protein